MKKFGLLIYIFSFSLYSLSYAIEKYSDKRITLEILQVSKKIEKGTENHFAVKVKLAKGWHIYWINPGDAGEPTVLEISTNIPNQSKIIPHYPIPHYKNTSGIVTLEYRNFVYFPFSIWIPKDFDKDILEIQLNAKWLVCKNICIPGKAKITKRFSFNRQIAKFKYENELLNSLKLIPRDTIIAQINLNPDNALLRFDAHFDDVIQKVFFYPITEGVFDLESEPRFSLEGQKILIQIPLVRYIWGDTSHIEGIAEFTFQNAKKKYFITKFFKQNGG